MQVTSKEYENVLDVVKLRQEMAENKNTSNPVNKRNTEIKPIFKWIALTIFITIFLILVTVPTALVTTGEMGKYYKLYDFIIGNKKYLHLYLHHQMEMNAETLSPSQKNNMNLLYPHCFAMKFFLRELFVRHSETCTMTFLLMLF